MVSTREMINERLTSLDQREQQLLADLNAVHGAKQILQDMLAFLDKEEAKATPKVKRTRKPRKQAWPSPSLITDKKEEQVLTPGSSAS